MNKKVTFMILFIIFLLATVGIWLTLGDKNPKPPTGGTSYSNYVSLPFPLYRESHPDTMNCFLYPDACESLENGIEVSILGIIFNVVYWATFVLVLLRSSTNNMRITALFVFLLLDALILWWMVVFRESFVWIAV